MLWEYGMREIFELEHGKEKGVDEDARRSDVVEDRKRARRFAKADTLDKDDAQSLSKNGKHLHSHSYAVKVLLPSRADADSQ